MFPFLLFPIEGKVVSPILRHIFRSQRLLISAVFLAGSIGCFSTFQESKEAHEAGHSVPAHKPDSFSAALTAIADRQQQLTGEDWSTGVDSRTVLLQELRDIVGWLPELAAQTDLEKPDWDRIQRLTQSLLSQINASVQQKQTWQLPDNWQELLVLAEKADSLEYLTSQKENSNE